MVYRTMQNLKMYNLEPVLSQTSYLDKEALIKTLFRTS